MRLRRLGKLGEELGELQAVASRCIIQRIEQIDPSSGKVNRQRFEDEIADVLAQVALTIRVFDLDYGYILLRQVEKERQMKEWEDLMDNV